MKIAHLAVGDRSFYLPPEEAGQTMAAAAEARRRGEWLDVRDAGGGHIHLLIPSNALLVLREYEIDDAEPEPDVNDWASFDYDY